MNKKIEGVSLIFVPDCPRLSPIVASTSAVIIGSRLKLTGHLWRRKKELASNVWSPK